MPQEPDGRLPSPQFDDRYTLPLDSAASLMGCTTEKARLLYDYARTNARHGISGPLAVAPGQGRLVTLDSVMQYRRLAPQISKTCNK